MNEIMIDRLEIVKMKETGLGYFNIYIYHNTQKTRINKKWLSIYITVFQKDHS